MSPDPAALGGKGANLVLLRDAGFPVPQFVVLSTAEYREFCDANGLDAVIAQALSADDAQQASEVIRSAFRCPIEPAQRRRITEAVTPLLDRPLAVRSSATAEDLPEASFAGQQDTFLGVRDLAGVLDAIVECWSSLWTERAIIYRDRNRVPHDQVGLAVVVQELVDADASGVMFTADPLTGHRGHAVVDAVLGLGDKLVSGQVIPDHWEVDQAGTILARTVMGGHPALSEGQLKALVELGRKVATHFGAPQDLEWVRVGEVIQLVQTRPITSLYPLPEPSAPDALWFSFGAFQGMLDPITPLGRDLIGSLFVGAAPLFGGKGDHSTNPYLRPAGERLWLRLDGMLRTVPGRQAMVNLLQIADPNAAAVLRRFADEDAYAPARGSRRRVVAVMGPFLRLVLPRIVAAILRPQGAWQRLTRETEAIVVGLAGQLAEAGAKNGPVRQLKARVQAMDWFTGRAFPTLLPAFAPIMSPSTLLLLWLRHLAAATGLPDSAALAASLLRAVPGNVTTQMDLELWEVARSVRDDPVSAETFRTVDASVLAERYLAGTLPPVAQDGIEHFMHRYGMRGVGEIDLGAPRWGEHPEGVLRTITSYLDLNPNQAPDVRYHAGRREARASTRKLAAASKPLAALQVRFAASRLRALFGARETPKFTIVRAFSLLRTAMQASGQDLVDAGILTEADDVFFLHLDELGVAFERPDLRPLVAQRREVYAREQRRRRIPVVMVGDGRTFYDGGEPTDADLAGMGVSPGVVEAVVRVVDDPRTSELQPGEIMVCRGTDPAWTPLFLTASGLVTEVGGLMTHGSVVAREYGLPAVVGVGGATQALSSGQRIRLDGTAGTITFID